MVARGAGAAGPVLLACRQWDPLGLARRLPSLEVGAWRCAPLLPWRVQFPVRVCAALAAGSGGSGWYLVWCLSRFPHPAPRDPRCVWRAVPSGCPLPSLAGTPFHEVCAFCELGLVALLVVPVCPLRVCALALPRRPLPPPLGGVGCAPRAVPALRAGRATPRGPCLSACPALVPCSVWRALGGGGPVPVPPYLAWGCCCEGRLTSGAPPPPTARPLGGPLGSAANVLWARVCGCGGKTLSPSPACPVGAACRGDSGRPSPGGMACHRCERRLVSGAVPPPAARPLGRAAGVPRPVCPGCGQCGCGDPAPAPRHAPLRAGVPRRPGWRKDVPGGGRRLPLSGASGVRRSPFPGCPRSGRAAGAHYPLAVSAGGCGRGDPSRTPQRALLRVVGAA